MKNRRGFNPDARIKDADFAFRVLSDSVFTKGFLGRSLRENSGLPSVGVSSARRAGVIVDENGKMRCPPGTPNANQFTDINMSNCMVPSAETVAQEAKDKAVEAAKKLLGGFRRGKVSSPRPDNSDVKRAGLTTARPDGFLSAKRITKGNKVISPSNGAEIELSFQSDATRHIADGGDLADIPDDFLVEAILLNTGEGKRFEEIGRGGGVNGMRRLRDGKTGAFIGVKYETGFSMATRNDDRSVQEQRSEFASEMIAERLGYEPMPMRMVPVRTNPDSDGPPLGMSIVTELAHNRTEGKLSSFSVRDTEMVDLESLLRMGVLDAIIGNKDRNQNNYLVRRDEQGRGTLIPIDHSITLKTGHVGPMSEKETWGVVMGGAPILLTMGNVKSLDDYNKMLEDVNKIIADLKEIDLDELASSLAEIDDMLKEAGINFDELKNTQKMKEGFEAAIKRIDFLRNQTPEFVAELIIPRNMIIDNIAINARTDGRINAGSLNDIELQAIEFLRGVEPRRYSENLPEYDRNSVV